MMVGEKSSILIKKVKEIHTMNQEKQQEIALMRYLS